MSDAIHPFAFPELPVRGFWVRLDSTWHDSVHRHGYPAAVAAHLGELQLASAVLAHSIKRRGLLTLQATGDGPVGALMAECRDQQGLRGIARLRDAAAIPDQPDLPALLGRGNLAITIRQDDQRAPYQAVVPLDGARVAQCLERYFMQSEQLPTRLWLAARYTADGPRASGLMLQRLPGESSDEDAWRRLGLLADTMQDDELLELPVQTLLTRLFHEDGVRLHAARPLAFQCSCSRERTADALRMMGAEEVRDILREDGAVQVDCQFCGQHYAFHSDDVDALFLTH